MELFFLLNVIVRTNFWDRIEFLKLAMSSQHTKGCKRCKMEMEVREKKRFCHKFLVHNTLGN